MSAFDPTSFLSAEITEDNSTETIPIPEGEYIASIDSMEVRTWVSKKDPTKSGVVLEVKWEIFDTALAESIAKDRVFCRQSVMLDLNSQGSLDFSRGRNISLGRLRAAVGLNVPGQPFAFTMLPGQQATIKVGHRTDDQGLIYDEVKAVRSTTSE